MTPEGRLTPEERLANLKSSFGGFRETLPEKPPPKPPRYKPKYPENWVDGVNYGLLEPGDHRHGTIHGYTNLVCRCDDCRRVCRETSKARRDRQKAEES